MVLQEASQELAQAYHEGWLAGQAKILQAPVRRSNPYEEDTDEWYSWNAGYRAALNEDEHTLNT